MSNLPSPELLVAFINRAIELCEKYGIDPYAPYEEMPCPPINAEPKAATKAKGAKTKKGT
jgi:hypothetical protein